MKISKIIIPILILGFLYFCGVQKLDHFSTIILCFSFGMSVYFSKYFDFKSFTNSKYDVELIFNNLGIPRIEYNDVLVLRKIADTYIWPSRLLAISLPMLIAVIGKSVFKLGYSYSQYISILGTALGFLFHYNDAKKLWKIWFGKRNCFHVKFLKEDVELIETETVKYSHRDVYFYEEAFCDYSVDDLRRELILIEQDISNSNKTGFWDKYLVPVLFLMTTSTVGIMNALVVADLSQIGNDIDILMKYYFVGLFIIVMTLLQIFIFKYFMITPTKTNLVLKKFVLEDLLENKNKQQSYTVEAIERVS